MKQCNIKWKLRCDLSIGKPEDGIVSANPEVAWR